MSSLGQLRACRLKSIPISIQTSHSTFNVELSLVSASITMEVIDPFPLKLSFLDQLVLSSRNSDFSFPNTKFSCRVIN